MSTEIKPLLEDPSTHDDLRRVLDAASAHDPSGPELARLGAKLAAALPPGAFPPGAPPAAPSAPVAAAGSIAGKVAAGLAVVAIGSAAWLALSPRSPTPTPPSPSVAAPLVEAPAVEPSSTVPSVTVDALPSASATASSDRPVPPPAPIVAAPPEATLLARAHAELLRGAPAEALATTREHARAYPRGLLAQEREVIAIEALVALGRRTEARTRADTFRLDYPGSSHEARLTRLLADP